MGFKDIRGGDALELIERIIDPAQDILGDPEVVQAASDPTLSYLQKAKIVLKLHKRSVLEVLAAVDGVDVKEYNDNIIDMLRKIIELMNDPDLAFLFPSQGQIRPSSGSATENTTEAEEK